MSLHLLLSSVGGDGLKHVCVSRTGLARSLGVFSYLAFLHTRAPHPTPPDPLTHTHHIHELTPTRLPLHPSPVHETSGLGPAGSPMFSLAPCPLLALAFRQRARVREGFSGQPAPPAVAKVPCTSREQQASPVLDPHAAQSPQEPRTQRWCCSPQGLCAGSGRFVCPPRGGKRATGPLGRNGEKRQVPVETLRGVGGERGVREPLKEAGRGTKRSGCLWASWVNLNVLAQRLEGAGACVGSLVPCSHLSVQSRCSVNGPNGSHCRRHAWRPAGPDMEGGGQCDDRRPNAPIALALYLPGIDVVPNKRRPGPAHSSRIPGKWPAQGALTLAEVTLKGAVWLGTLPRSGHTSAVRRVSQSWRAKGGGDRTGRGHQEGRSFLCGRRGRLPQPRGGARRGVSALLGLGVWALQSDASKATSPPA